MSNGQSLADHITLELRADIIGGRLVPGMALVENDLVSAYNASRNTIRGLAPLGSGRVDRVCPQQRGERAQAGRSGRA